MLFDPRWPITDRAARNAGRGLGNRGLMPRPKAIPGFGRGLPWDLSPVAVPKYARAVPLALRALPWVNAALVGYAVYEYFIAPAGEPTWILPPGWSITYNCVWPSPPNQPPAGFSKFTYYVPQPPACITGQSIAGMSDDVTPAMYLDGAFTEMEAYLHAVPSLGYRGRTKRGFVGPKGTSGPRLAQPLVMLPQAAPRRIPWLLAPYRQLGFMSERGPIRDKVPDIVMEVSSDGKRARTRTTLTERAPPREKEKEVKPKSNVHPRSFIGLLYGAVTEGIELIDALYDGLPSKLRYDDWVRKGRPEHGLSPDQKLQLVYDNLHKIDVAAALQNLVENYLEDFAIGKLSQAQIKALQKNPFWIRPVGPGTGLAYGVRGI